LAKPVIKASPFGVLATSTATLSDRRTGT
jgi:hypothetical protein